MCAHQMQVKSFRSKHEIFAECLKFSRVCFFHTFSLSPSCSFYFGSFVLLLVFFLRLLFWFFLLLFIFFNSCQFHANNTFCTVFFPLVVTNDAEAKRLNDNIYFIILLPFLRSDRISLCFIFAFDYLLLLLCCYCIWRFVWFYLFED